MRSLFSAVHQYFSLLVAALYNFWFNVMALMFQQQHTAAGLNRVKERTAQAGDSAVNTVKQEKRRRLNIGLGSIRSQKHKCFWMVMFPLHLLCVCKWTIIDNMPGVSKSKCSFIPLQTRRWSSSSLCGSQVSLWRPPRQHRHSNDKNEEWVQLSDSRTTTTLLW